MLQPWEKWTDSSHFEDHFHFHFDLRNFISTRPVFVFFLGCTHEIFDFNLRGTIHRGVRLEAECNSHLRRLLPKSPLSNGSP